jgi:hypothetical protein
MEIALDTDMKLIDNGDEFMEDETEATDARLIFLLMKGELRYAPWLGFGAIKKVRSVSNEKTFVRQLKVELESDGFRNPVVDVSEGIDKLKMYV